MSKNIDKCATCGICNVPLYDCLDGKKRCADHVSMLEVAPKKEEAKCDGQS